MNRAEIKRILAIILLIIIMVLVFSGCEKNSNITAYIKQPNGNIIMVDVYDYSCGYTFVTITAKDGLKYTTSWENVMFVRGKQ